MTSEPLFPILASKAPAVREVNLIRQAQRYLVWQVLCPWCGWMLVLLSDGRELLHPLSPHRCPATNAG